MTYAPLGRRLPRRARGVFHVFAYRIVRMPHAHISPCGDAARLFEDHAARSHDRISRGVEVIDQKGRLRGLDQR